MERKFTDLHRNPAASSTQHQLFLTCGLVMRRIERNIIYLPGVAMPPAAKFTTGKRFSLAVSLRRWKGA